jgi:hypothetical protein
MTSSPVCLWRVLRVFTKEIVVKELTGGYHALTNKRCEHVVGDIGIILEE